MQDKQIFIKGENRTQDVLNCKYVNNRYYITYKDGKTYPYSVRDIKDLLDNSGCFDEFYQLKENTDQINYFDKALNEQQVCFNETNDLMNILFYMN